MGNIDKLEKLFSLHKQGILTNEEYEEGKRALRVDYASDNTNFEMSRQTKIIMGALVSSVIIVLLIFTLTRFTGTPQLPQGSMQSSTIMATQGQYPDKQIVPPIVRRSDNHRDDLPLDEQSYVAVGWLDGTWSHEVNRGLRCDTDVVVEFNRNGTFSDSSSYGKFRLTPDRQHIVYFNRIIQPDPAEGDSTEDRSQIKRKITTRVERLSRDIMREDGELWYRCKTKS